MNFLCRRSFFGLACVLTSCACHAQGSLAFDELDFKRGQQGDWNVRSRSEESWVKFGHRGSLVNPGKPGPIDLLDFYAVGCWLLAGLPAAAQDSSGLQSKW